MCLFVQVFVKDKNSASTTLNYSDLKVLLLGSRWDEFRSGAS